MPQENVEVVRRFRDHWNRDRRASLGRGGRLRATIVVAALRPAGYKAADQIDRGKDDVAESHSRVRSWATIAAFTLIIALTVAEGVDEGFSLWDWLIIPVGAVFILQALFRLEKSRSAPT
jgi:hypothetical protein